MKNYNVTNLNPELDLVLERIIPVSPEKVWTCITTPELVQKWFAPQPWKITSCKIDLRPGGEFTSVMQSPEGQSFPNSGCILVVEENKRMVWTDSLAPGFRPSEKPFFTADVTLEAVDGGTKYTARAIHGNMENVKVHKDMGFEQGWGTCLDQMVAVALKL